MHRGTQMSTATTTVTTEVGDVRRRVLLKRARDHGAATHSPAREHVRASGLTVRVRSIHDEDSALLADIFARLSPASRLARFLVPKWGLTASELRYLTEVDHHNHEAVIALTRLRGEPVGVARFVRDSGDPTSAEVAVEVVDEWQGRGVGSLMVRRLAARARSEDVTQFTALMSADNTRSRRLLSKFGEISLVERDGATVSYRILLPSSTSAPAHR
jgi:RimJ/RimL family protein N-acetyltransferase